ncbi:MAG: ParB/RepB/Spo0J family partition protein [Lentisphaerae bacterium]|nr:ParB/RepB/Spo0J family partition protein [Lentisphaerota bacterium]
MAGKHGLGRGLSALIKEVPSAKAVTPPPVPTKREAGLEEITMVAVDKIRPNPKQPRHKFTPEALEDLVHSIQAHGILQPLLMRQIGQHYELLAGERRWRAARQAGLETVPAILKEVSDRDALELTLIENLQREDLDPIEEAEGYRTLAEQFALSQEDIAQRVGKARATVTNALRLLTLPEEIKQMLTDGRLSTGHAKVLLGVTSDEEKCLLARRVVKEGWSVRVVEKAVERLGRAPRKPRAMRADIPGAYLQDLSAKLHQHFGTSVRLTPSHTLANGKKVRGTIEIDFYSNEDLTRILGLLGLANQG